MKIKAFLAILLTFPRIGAREPVGGVIGQGYGAEAQTTTPAFAEDRRFVVWLCRRD